MSKRVEKLIKEEDRLILDMIHNDEAIYVEAVYELDKDGKRVYDWEIMEYDFYTSMENLISLNKQAGRDIAGEMCDDLVNMVRKNEN